MSAPAAPPQPLSREAGRLYTHPLLLMLLAAYACNFMDRTVIATLAQAIKLDLKVTDAQLGLLQGLAFVALYSVMGLPIARLAERRDRVSIISICIAVWSAMTMLCGLAQGYLQLLLFRVGVGIGEAGCNAPSHSMIADAFGPGRRARAISVYNIGATIGTMIGAMSAGVIAERFGWRAAFVAVGMPGLALAVVLRLTTRDPGHHRAAPNPPRSEAAPVAAAIVGSPALRMLVLGFTLTSFGVAGLGSFTQPYVIRAFGLTYGQVGLVFGAFGGLAGIASLVSSGRLADAAIARDQRWHAWIPAIGVALSIPFAVGAYTLGPWPLAVGLSFGATLFVNWFIAPTLSAIHKLVGERRVAMALALILMFQNLFGLGMGPFFTGAAIDLAAQHLFSASGHGDFRALCPGGTAPAHAAIALAGACHDAVVHGTRIGMLVTLVAHPLAIWAFLRAGRRLRRELAS